MAIPTTAVSIGQIMDPKEELDFAIDVAGLLEVGENVASYTLSVFAEAVALGLAIMSGSGRNAFYSLVTKKVSFWLAIDVGNQSNVAYDGAGASLGLLLTIITDATPARTRQRTVVVRAAQQ
jgi:hypothetical protein